MARNAGYWAGPPRLERVRFSVVPDAVTVALELEKGSADVASNELTLDLVQALERRPGLATETGAGSRVMYLNFNVSRGPLADVRVRQAVACAMDREAIIGAVYRGQAAEANTLLPDGHWAQAQVSGYAHDVGRARTLLETAGYRAGKDGVRVRLEMKTSQDETTRLIAEILQQQLAEAGIALTLRATEFGTFYGDVTAGRFEMYALNWVGSNEDPDIFSYAYASARVPPKGGNRGRFASAEVDRELRVGRRKALMNPLKTGRGTGMSKQLLMERCAHGGTLVSAQRGRAYDAPAGRMTAPARWKFWTSCGAAWLQ